MSVPSFRRGLRAALPLLIAIVLARAAAAASFPPALKFRSIVTGRVTVTYHQGLEAMAREAAALAEEILVAHQARYGGRVRRVEIVLSDVDDDPNGFASPLPYPLVGVRAVAPNGSDDFGNHEGWLRLVLTHELAHIVHLEPARGLVGFARNVLGRAPFLFPNVFTPTWMIEGLAVYEETERTAFGRGRNPDSRMVLRMAALEGGFPTEDEAVYGLDRWPAGQTSYLFGEGFLRHLSDAAGPDTLPRLARAQSRQVIPYLDDLTASRVTGASFHAHWHEWALLEDADAHREATERRRRGLTASKALTTRGIRQTNPRFSPDGLWIAYSSRSLTRFPAIRLMRPDGSEDRQLVDRNGGSALSWTPDSRTLVFDELEVHRTFSRFYDLRAVEIGSGKVRRITRGLRARDPDVAPDGDRVVFVRNLGDRSELCLIGLDGKGLRPLTASVPGTEWGDPRFNKAGDQVVASRLLPGGLLDVVTVNLASGELEELTHDRAKDVEPVFTPDGTAVVFRSDRDGISNLYLCRLSDRALFRLTNADGGAFTPELSPDGAKLAFAAYSSRGYDVHLADFEPAAAPPAEPFVDTYPPPSAPVLAALPEPSPYRPLRTLWPHFWTPFFLSRDQEVLIGAATGGSDPLLRHLYGFDARVGTESGRLSGQGFYQYDRFYPTFLLALESDEDLQRGGRLETRDLNLRATLPVSRKLRSSQSVSLTFRRERQLFDPTRGRSEALDLGGLEAAWALSSTKQYPFSISPLDGARLRVAVVQESPHFGSDVSLEKLTADARGYLRVLGEDTVLAARLSGGLTAGSPAFQRSFAVGGFPDANLFDLQRTNLAVLRGYPANAFTGRSYLAGNLELRLPLGALQRGWRTLPVFIRHFHAALFADAGNAWSGELRFADLKTSLGVALGADTYLGHRLPFTGVLGVARGLGQLGETQVYFRTGLSF